MCGTCPQGYRGDWASASVSYSHFSKTCNLLGNFGSNHSCNHNKDLIMNIIKHAFSLANYYRIARNFCGTKILRIAVKKPSADNISAFNC